MLFLYIQSNRLHSFYIVLMEVGKPGQRVSSAQHVNEYIQYCNLVGDNGGVLMTEKEFQDYKKNYAQLSENRLYTSWYNPEGLCCKAVGPSSKCFCDHAYKNHNFLEGTGGKVKCKNPGCKCGDFYYIPIYGSQDFKCSCKHSYQQHDVGKKNCKGCACKVFASSWSCTCGFKFGDHKTVHENKGEKEVKGEVVNKKAGGVVSYSSMLDGAERFEYGIKEEIKQKGIKVSIEEFVINKNLELRQDVSAFELMNRPLGWMK